MSKYPTGNQRQNPTLKTKTKRQSVEHCCNVPMGGTGVSRIGEELRALCQPKNKVNHTVIELMYNIMTRSWDG